MSSAPDVISEVQSLLVAAKRDALAFELLAQQPAAPAEVMFFLAQQAIEKSIKCVLANRKVSYRKTHDLVELAALLTDDSLRSVLPEDLMIRLGPYAVELRYVNLTSPHVDLHEVRPTVAAVLTWSEQSVQR